MQNGLISIDWPKPVVGELQTKHTTIPNLVQHWICPEDCAVLSFEHGKAAWAGWLTCYKKRWFCLLVDHGGGWSTRYCWQNGKIHPTLLSDPSDSDTWTDTMLPFVKQRQILALVTGDFLFELRQNNVLTDPNLFWWNV